MPRILILLDVLALLLLAGCQPSSQYSLRPDLPGRIDGQRILLPNGWYLSPAGTQIDVGDTPLNFDIDPRGQYAVVSNNGAGGQSVSVVDLRDQRTTQTIPLEAAWLGIRFYDNGSRFAVSGGAGNRVYLFSMDRGTAALTDSIVVAPPWDSVKMWLGGLDIDEHARRLYVCGRQTKQLFAIDLNTNSIAGTVTLPGMPYACLMSRNGNRLYVSIWSDSSVVAIDTRTLEIAGTASVGSHPCDMAESPDGRRLFVANANENSVSVIDLESGSVIEEISASLYPGSLPGGTPNSVALTADGRTLYIANADNNSLAVIDVSRFGQSRSLGFIPTGWYPSCVRVNNTTGELLVANAKGVAGSGPNPDGPAPGRHAPPDQYTGTMFHGTLSVMDRRLITRQAELTRAVYDNSKLKGAAGTFTAMPDASPIPLRHGETSPIKYVIYIIKENRTYDQVFGDMPEGNGDSSLTIFGEKFTPNLHALAREFVLLDNFYCEAEVSADGHAWSTAAYATDYIEKTWPTHYGGFGGDYDFEVENPMAWPANGYLWDNAMRNGITWRNYGEQVKMGETAADPQSPKVPAQVGNTDTLYRGWDLDYSDVDRAKEWIREFDEFEKNGNLPRLHILTLPNDHTAGTRKGALTPWAMVAQNDLAVGMIIERLSRSRYWKESAVFIVEDDAQNGSDHVDAHRTTALVISPYVRRHAVDHTLYSTSSMVRTMELILGLPPMSQYDASATPMVHSFTMTPDTTPYALRPARIDITERNIAGMYGQEECGRMNFAAVDAAPDVRLNEIIWKSIRGAASPMPPPVRSAFVKLIETEEEEE